MDTGEVIMEAVALSIGGVSVEPEYFDGMMDEFGIPPAVYMPIYDVIIDIVDAEVISRARDLLPGYDEIHVENRGDNTMMLSAWISDGDDTGNYLDYNGEAVDWRDGV